MKKHIALSLLVVLSCNTHGESWFLKKYKEAEQTFKKATKTTTVHNRSNKNMFFKFTKGNFASDNTMYFLAPQESMQVDMVGPQLTVIVPKKAGNMAFSELKVAPRQLPGHAVNVILKTGADLRKSVALEPVMGGLPGMLTVNNNTGKIMFVRQINRISIGESDKGTESVTMLQKEGDDASKTFSNITGTGLHIIVASSLLDKLPYIQETTVIPVDQNDVDVFVQTDMFGTPQQVVFEKNDE